MKRTWLAVPTGALVALTLAAANPVTAGTGSSGCVPYPGRKGAVCPPVMGEGVIIIAQPGYRFGSHGAFGPQPSMGHIFVCKDWDDSVAQDYTDTREVFLGGARSGCNLGSCPDDPINGGYISDPCDPAVQTLLANVVNCTNTWTTETNDLGLRICSAPASGAGRNITFRIRYFVSPSGSPTLSLSLKHGNFGGVVNDFELTGPQVPNSSYDYTRYFANGSYNLQLVLQDIACDAPLTMIGETEVYRLDVTPTGVTLRQHPNMLEIPFGC